jgi:SAM-dependent methyltransferase
MSYQQQIRELHEKISRPAQQRLIDINLANIDDLWREQYAMIKDESWPCCSTVDEFKFLPNWIQEECKQDHGLDPELMLKKIIDDANNVIVADDCQSARSYEQQILSRNRDIILGHDIIDFACNTGSYSFEAIHHGANSVVGFDIREDWIALANLWAKEFQLPSEKIKFLKLDIHDYEGITGICQNATTALVPGIMYHIHDHYQVLEAIANANVQNIIIETKECEEISRSDHPLIWWNTEPAAGLLKGRYGNHATVLAGLPNISWFKLAAKTLGYDHYSTEYPKLSKYNNARSVHVFKRSNNIED